MLGTRRERAAVTRISSPRRRREVMAMETSARSPKRAVLRIRPKTCTRRAKPKCFDLDRTPSPNTIPPSDADDADSDSD